MTAAVPPRRAALAFIFVTVLLDILAIGIVIPVLPRLIEDFLAGDTARAALWVGAFGTAFALAQFVFSPVQGAASDRFGRRPVILVSNLGLGLDFILMALANTLPMLFLGRVLAGITSASQSTANAYIADITPADQRAARYGMLGAAFGIGFVIGPALGGLLGSIDLRWPFWFAAGLCLTNFCYGWLILPESLPPQQRTAFSWRRANPASAVVWLRATPRLFGLVATAVLSQLAHYALPAVFVLYTGYRYGWSEQSIGLVLALVGICNVLVQALLVRRLVARLGERQTLALGLICGCGGFAWMALASDGHWFLGGIPLMALWGLAGPALQGLLTAQVTADQQGRLQGALTSLVSLTGIVAPALFSGVFSRAIAPTTRLPLPGAAFLLAAGLLGLAAVVGWRASRGSGERRHPQHHLAGQALHRSDEGQFTAEGLQRSTDP